MTLNIIICVVIICNCSYYCRNCWTYKVLHLVNILGSSLKYSPTPMCAAAMQGAWVKNLMKCSFSEYFTSIFFIKYLSDISKFSGLLLPEVCSASKILVKVTSIPWRWEKWNWSPSFQFGSLGPWNIELELWNL